MPETFEVQFIGEASERKSKEEIYKESEDEIREILKTEPDEIKRWGNIYELFVKRELSKEREGEETEIEKLFRTTIEYMYSKADLFTGKDSKHHAGKPDGIKVGFRDERIIVEVVEMKSSYYAYEHGRDCEQPKRTLESLVLLVEIINLLSEGRGNMWILSKFPKIPKDKILEWKNEINELRLKLQKASSELGQKIPKIDISDMINYRIVTPSDEKMNGFKQEIIHDDSNEHKISVTNEKSLLSKSELHQIIEHNLEQISK